MYHSILRGCLIAEIWSNQKKSKLNFIIKYIFIECYLVPVNKLITKIS